VKHRRDREPPEEKDNLERWLVSYADFITLMFSFFVLLYATSRIDNKKLVDLEKAIKFAMHFKGTGGVGELPIFKGPQTDSGCPPSAVQSDRVPRLGPQDRRVIEALRKKIMVRLRHFLQDRPESQIVQIETEGKRLIVRLSAAHFFDSMKAAIRPEMIPVLDAIAAELTQLGKPLRIDGHTDDRRLTNIRFRDNWELSASRAAAVASYVQRAFQFDPKLISATGFGSARPFQTNETPAGREANRRVEMVIEVGPADPLDQLAQ
jgi:chemotaxis protein MotB